MSKTLVIGIDGGGWDLITPWIQEGALPNIADIMQDGCYGKLQSTSPATTCPAWRCYSTGKNPGKLGVYWWVNVDWENQELPLHNSQSFKSYDMWEYMNRAGIKTGIINMPTTYPPKPVDGFMICSWWSPPGSQYTYPYELKDELKKKYNYRIRPPYFNPKKKEESAKQIYDLFNLRFQVLKDKLHEGEVDFIHLTLFYINTLHHYFWDDEVTKQGWQIIDSHLGELLKDRSINLFIISDHGSIKIDAAFHINTWLQSQGYLSIQRNSSELLSQCRINKENLKLYIDRLGLGNIARRLIPPTLRKKIPYQGNLIATKDLDAVIDWEKTTVLALGQGPVYINQKKTGTDYDKFREELRQKLLAVTHPVTGEQIFREVLKKEEVYWGDEIKEAPDLFLKAQHHYYLAGSLAPKIFDDELRNWKAENKDTGLLFAIGPDIADGRPIEHARIIDIAPTILHLMDIPIPDDMDGDVLLEVYAEDSDAALREIKHQKNLTFKENLSDFDRDDDEIKERLRRLGYLE